jgi:hypothetical protein
MNQPNPFWLAFLVCVVLERGYIVELGGTAVQDSFICVSVFIDNGFRST